MTTRRIKLCRPLARGSRCTLARCLSDRLIKKYIVKGLGVSLRHEIAWLCSDNSTCTKKDPNTLKEFSWKGMVNEAKKLAPTLTELLVSCTKTRKPRKNQNAIIGLLFAVMCKHRRPALSLIQQVVSLILYSGHASKRVSDKRRLQYLWSNNNASNLHRFMTICRRQGCVCLMGVPSNLLTN